MESGGGRFHLDLLWTKVKPIENPSYNENYAKVMVSVIIRVISLSSQVQKLMSEIYS